MHPNGEAVIVPKGAQGPFPADSGNGMKFTGGRGGNGLSPKAVDVRIMNPHHNQPHPQPTGYTSYSNRSGQVINPVTGKTIPKTDPYWHWAFE
ncbi:hypothetical protein GCM10027511_41870 [Hymenobacter humi]